MNDAEIYKQSFFFVIFWIDFIRNWHRLHFPAGSLVHRAFNQDFLG